MLDRIGFAKLTIGQKLGTSFGMLMLLTVAVAGFVLVLLARQGELQSDVVDHRHASVAASQDALAEVHRSLASMRGYLILKDEEFEQDFDEAWVGIEKALSRLDALAPQLARQQDVERLARVRSLISELQGHQRDAMEVAKSRENQPALVLLTEEAAPRFDLLAEQTTRMIETEKAQRSAQARRDLLTSLANLRFSITAALAELRLFVHTGEPDALREFEHHWGRNGEVLSELRSGRHPLTATQQGLSREYESVRAELAGVIGRVRDLRTSEEWDRARYILETDAVPVAREIEQLLVQMAEHHGQRMAEGDAALEQTALQLRRSTAGASFVALVVGCLLSWAITRDIVSRVQEVVRASELVSRGDLTASLEVKTQDELGSLATALNGTISNLRRTIGSIVEASARIAQGSGQIKQGNTDLSTRTQQQAAALEECSSTVEEITSMVRQNAESAMSARKLANEAVAKAESGSDVVSEAVQAMGQINASSKKIAEISGVIDELAFQTNLLALNAAVEAARAGDQGRGFAVVASEVRSLAQRSASAAKDIKDLIGDSVEKVEYGTELVDRSGSMLSEIVEAVKRSSVIATEISAASEEQAKGMDQINTAVGEMDQLTQQNSSLVEEVASASESMARQTQQLMELTRFFQVEQGGAAPVAALPAVDVEAGAAPPVRMRGDSGAGDDAHDWRDF